MAITPINDSSKFIEWKNIINDIIVALGTLSSLTTTDKSTIVAAINEIDGDVAAISITVAAIISDIGTLSNLTTTDKSNLVAAINEVVANVTNNASNISVNSTDIGDKTQLTTTDKTNLVNAINELDLHVAPDVYYQNHDTGKFSLDTGITITTFNKGSFFNSHNASTLLGGDKFIDDNANNGGAGGSMGVDAVSLTTYLGTQGRTELRYGYEFFIMDITSGGGTADVIVENVTNYYPVTTNSGIYLGAIGDIISWAGYVRNEDAVNTILIGSDDSNIITWVDGVEQATPLELANATGWVFVRQTITLTHEYKNLFPALSAKTTGSVINTALSALYRANKKTQHLGVVQ